MKTILIVDDEKNIVSGLEEAFTLEGYNVLTAYDGKEAWDKVNTNNVDLVITDLRMPMMNGLIRLNTMWLLIRQVWILTKIVIR